MDNRPAKSSIAQQAVSLLRSVFHTEKHLVYHTQEEKAAERRKKIRLLLDSFYDYISQARWPLGKLKNAIQNALALKSRVYRIFENGQVPLTNNPVEQAIRPSTLIRKNSLFSKSIRGAQASAVYYTIVGTAKMNHLNIYKYFKYLFDHLPNRENKDLEGFLPWAKEAQAQCHI
ncbi:IS66 family transposase [Pediococcus parvulus]|uniref:IS66 family transposase n=1 Tax=Pediococcus parvulus TaxID=54062 RepID=UPI00345E8330